MSDLIDLYQEIILDHNKHPYNERAIEGCSCCAEGYNPLCGDQIKVFVKLDKDKIQDVSFECQGCAISKASASLMTVNIKGRTIVDAQKLIQTVNSLFTSEEEPKSEVIDELGDLGALIGVRAFPARVKCATLSWHALKAALEGGDKTSTED